MTTSFGGRSATASGGEITGGGKGAERVNPGAAQRDAHVAPGVEADAPKAVQVAVQNGEAATGSRGPEGSDRACSVVWDAN